MQRQLSQVEIGRRIKVDPSLIARFENGTRPPKRWHVHDLCTALNLSAFECERLYRTAGYVYNVNVTSLETAARTIMDHYGFDDDIVENVDFAWKALIRMAEQVQEARRA